MTHAVGTWIFKALFAWQLVHLMNFNQITSNLSQLLRKTRIALMHVYMFVIQL